VVAEPHDTVSRELQRALHPRRACRSEPVSGQIDLFNMLNSSYVQTQNVQFGPALGTPTKILQPRVLRLAMQMRF
jgi:hypothetical protein